MKKLFVILILVSISINLFSQIKIKGNAKIGYESLSMRLSQITGNEDWVNFAISPEFSFMGEIGVKAIWKGFEVKTKVHTIFYKNNSGVLSFTPMLAEYVSSIGYTFKSLGLKYEHSRTHNVSNQKNYLLISGGYDRFYLELEF